MAFILIIIFVIKPPMPILFVIFFFALNAHSWEARCINLFENSMTYNEYNTARETNPQFSSSNLQVRVFDFKKNFARFVIGASADKYVGYEYKKKYPRLVSIHQAKGSSKVYLLVKTNNPKVSYENTTQVVEFDLSTKQSRTLLIERNDLYSTQMVVNESIGIVILKGEYQSSARYESYYFTNEVSILISTEPQIKDSLMLNYISTITHASTQHGATRFGRSNLRYMRYTPQPGDIQSVEMNGKTFYPNSTSWMSNGQYLLTVGYREVQISTLNTETHKLVPVDSTDAIYTQLKTNRAIL